MNKFTYLLLLLFCMMGGVTKAYAEIGDPIQKDGWKISASSWCWDDKENGKDDRIIDGDIQTYWHSNWRGDSGTGTGGSLPEWFVVDLGSIQEIGGVGYTPRQHANANGNCKSYKLFISTDNTFADLTKESVNQLQNPLKEGVLNKDAQNISKQYVKFDKQESARYILFVITESYGDQANKFGNCGEFDVYQYVTTSTSVTYNYTLDGVIKESKTVSQGVGTKYNAPSLNVKYITFEQPTGQVTEGPNTVTVNCTVQGLPFEVSNSIDDNANWYKLFIQRSNVKTASYNPNNNRVNNYETVPYNTTCEWFAFQGNPFDGFKIYNYAAGNNKILWSASVENNALISFVEKSETTEGSDWDVLKNGDKGFVFKKKNAENGFINDVESQIGYWKVSNAATDAGSTFKFEKVDITAQKTAAALGTRVRVIETKYPHFETSVYKILGLDTSSLDEASKQYADNLNKFKAGTVTEDVVALIEKNDNTMINGLKTFSNQLSTKYYRIKNAFADRQAKPYITANATKATNDALVSSNATQIWQVELNANHGTFKLYSTNLEKYLQNPDKGGAVNETGNDYNISVRDNQTVNFSIGNRYLVMYGGGGIGGWNSESAGTDGAWTIEPVTTLEVSLNALGSESYATTYLPFSISKVEGATAYIGKVVKQDNKNILHATAIKGGIPANQGVILKGAANAEKAVLTLGKATSDVQNNALIGTLVEKDYTNELVFGVNNNVVGFYSMATGKKIGANKAYLEAAAARAMKLVFDGDVTGIENVMGEAADANAPIYDLTGRRVMKAVKGGLYIQNGKKFIAQ